MNVLEAVSRLSGTDLLSLCVPGGNCDFRKLDFDRGISVGIVCRRRRAESGGHLGMSGRRGLNGLF